MRISSLKDSSLYNVYFPHNQDVNSNFEMLKNGYQMKSSSKEVNDNKFYTRDKNSWMSDDDSCGLWFGVFFCIFFIFLFLFVLWYPFQYYTTNNNINGNGIPDHRERYLYYHSYYYWPNY